MNTDNTSKFNQLGLSDNILEVLDEIGFETPTPIQEQAIPMMLENDPTDFIGLAQTGTGKTAAFGLPLLDLIDTDQSHVQGLIMAPTRELGQQIAQQLTTFSRNNKALNIEVVYGGAAIYNQIKALQRPTQIVVATPGRLLDLIRRKAISLDKVDYVVLDEADEMLNMGFKEDIDTILESTGENAAIWLFSATMPPAIRKIIATYMDDPREVKVNTQEISNKDITHQYVVTKRNNRFSALRRFLDMEPDMRGVLFCRTKRETEQIAADLGDLGYSVAALNGDLSQAQRDKVMRQFKKRSMQLLIATDVAARGIDVKDLTHVIHHSLPDQIEYYTHRSGRTGRAGNKGISLVLVGPREQRKIKDLERRIKVDFELVQIPSHEEVLSSRVSRWADLIVQTKVHDQAESILEVVREKFEELSKEDILKRLISVQLDHLMMQDDNAGDLNESDRDQRKDKKGRERNDRQSFKSKEGTNRYFINLGAMDGLTEADLIHFMTDITGISRKHFSGMSLQKKCAYFDVDQPQDKGFGDSFNGVQINGRTIRVNRDNAANRPPRKSWKKGGYGGGKPKAKKGWGKKYRGK